MKIVEAAKLKTGEYREFRAGDLRIATSLEKRANAKRLTVVLNGYCDRGASIPPVFVSWPESADPYGHILRVCDPTLFMADWLRLSCFLGTEAADPLPPIIDICRTFAAKLDVRPRNILYIGHSGAGFGALRSAILDQEAAAIGVNPVAEIGAYSEYQFAARLTDVFRPGATAAAMCAELPERSSISACLKPALAAGKAPRIALIQNVTDKTHFNLHYGAVCRTLGLPETGGSDPSGRFHSIAYDKRGGHSVPPDMSLIKTMAERLLADDRASATSATVS